MVAFLFPVDIVTATYGVMEVTRRFNRYFIKNNNNNNKKINIITIININIDNNNKRIITIIIIIINHMKIQISYWLLSHNTYFEIACKSLFRKLLHFALLHYALEKLLQFASKDYYILRWKFYCILRRFLLHFALILHFVAIITLRRNTRRFHGPVYFQSTFLSRK